MILVLFLLKSMQTELNGLSSKREATTISKDPFTKRTRSLYSAPSGHKLLNEHMQGVGNHKTRAVGFNISTKSIGSYRREVLDNDYKWPEGSEEEREAWQTAFNFSSVPDYFSSHLARFHIKKIFEFYIQGQSHEATLCHSRTHNRFGGFRLIFREK